MRSGELDQLVLIRMVWPVWWVHSRAALFTFAKNDTLKAMWAVDDTDGWLEATAATSYAPSAPAATISIIRVNQ